jgi:glyoxylase-like metal-dependent hydrolase (beta-lactamase superfamily II)
MRVIPLFLPLALLLPALAREKALKPTYDVYAISYAIIPDFSVAGLVAGADRARKLDIQMMVWLLKGSNGANVLVDSGFYREKYFKQWKVKDFIKPSEAIGKLGLKPEDITDLIITHMHWDHAGGLDLFQNARIWIQQDEYAYYTGDAWREGGSHGGVDAEDVLALVRLNTEGRVRLVKGDDQEAIDGIRFFTGGRHTYASQYVAVSVKTGTTVIASDNCYLYENLDKHVAIAQTLDAASNLRAQDRMRQLASSPRLIVPGHDPAVFTRFPAPGNGVAKIE